MLMLLKQQKISFGINGTEQLNSAPHYSYREVVNWLAMHPITPLTFSNGGRKTYVWEMYFQSGKSLTNISQLFTQLSVEQKLSFVPGLIAKRYYSFWPNITRNKAFRTPAHFWSVDTPKHLISDIDGIFEQTKPSLSEVMDYSKQFDLSGSL